MWFQHKVPRDVQAALVRNGFDDASIFGNIGDTKPEIRDCVAKDLGLRADLGILLRNIQGRIITAWEAANIRGTKRHHEEAEQRAADLPRAIPKNTDQEMVAAYEDAHE